MEEKRKPTVILSPQSAKGLLISLLFEHINKRVLAVITATEEEAITLKEDLDTLLKLFYGKSVSTIHLPEIPADSGRHLFENTDSEIKRISALYNLNNRSSPFVMIASQKALSHVSLPPIELKKHSILLKEGESFDIDYLKSLLLTIGYSNETNVDHREVLQ